MEKSKKNSVLIVDDENSSIIALTEILSTDYTVYAAKNGHDAIAAAEKHMPDVIVLDIVMPKMDGYMAISALKDKKKTSKIPVIIITKLDDIDEEVKGLALGAADYITKPFVPEIVKLRVQNQIEFINQTRLIIEKELAEKSHYAKIEFLIRMSHEMLTPMNTIIAMTNALKAPGGLSDKKDCIDKIDSSSLQLKNMINDLLDLSGKKSEALTLNYSDFSFNAMLQPVLRKAKQEMQGKNQTFTYDIDPSIPTYLIGDKDRLTQIITNLLANAIKFTPERGKSHFFAFVLDEDDETATLQIEITDSGIGISKEQQSEIFNVFDQVDDSMTSMHSGAGLGLAISKHLIELMGGKIWVESELDEGAKFIFTCKLRKA